VPKGRILGKLVPLLTRAGLDCASLEQDDRTLVRTSADGQFRFLLLKPDDVPTYVEYGAAELGISGRDTLLERSYDLYHRAAESDAGRRRRR
jgi:ATP phosphoribosyltransferase